LTFVDGCGCPLRECAFPGGHHHHLSGERRNGTWRLRVQDIMVFNTGHINSWTLTL
jgi:subtilisin-like proprotein convertase family protein